MAILSETVIERIEVVTYEDFHNSWFAELVVCISQPENVRAYQS